MRVVRASIAAGLFDHPLAATPRRRPVAPLDAITARAAQDGAPVTFDNGGDDLIAAVTAANPNADRLAGDRYRNHHAEARECQGRPGRRRVRRRPGSIAQPAGVAVRS